MKTVLVLAALVAIAYGSILPSHYQYKTKNVDNVFVERQKKILALFYNIHQVDENAEYYKIGAKYDVEAHINDYTDKNVVENFWTLWRTGFQPRDKVFSVFYDRQREEAIALFELFYYAKDFDVFYQTASWARIYFNPGQFLYSYYIAVLQRQDCNDYLLPAPYEVYPELFMNMRLVHEIYRVKQQGDIQFPEYAYKHGIVKENQDFVYYANYSDALTYPNEEQRLAYFTEDIGLNSYYYYFHAQQPFWWNADKYGTYKERRGEVYFFFYQQLLARYYLERLSNGLGEIPEFSWFSPIRVGYYPKLATWSTPFAQRSNWYLAHTEKNFEAVRFLDIFEKTFFQYLQNGHFKAFDQEIHFSDPKAINFVGNYWQTNADLYKEDFVKTYQRSYEVTARHVLGAAPAPLDKYTFVPSALDFYQTSLRDPAFYQLYNKIFNYMVQYKNYLKPYVHEDLHYVGVKINDVKVSKMETFFDLYDFDATNMIFLNKQDPKPYPHEFKIRQPRLNHKPFTVSMEVKSDAATEAVFKIWIGPKYDSKGYPISIENNWMNFVELDWFSWKLSPGVNKIERNSEDFFYFKEDSLPMYKVWSMLEEGKIPEYMSEKYDYMPKRLMLPKGTKGGFPFQIFVFAFPQNSIHKEGAMTDGKFNFLMETKSFGFPLDRPVKEHYFKQPNMFFEDVYVYHEGEEFPYKYANPEYKQHKEF